PRLDAGDAAPSEHLAATSTNFVGNGQRDAAEIDDAGCGAPECSDADGVPLDIADPFGPDDLQARHLVGDPSPVQLFESRKLLVVDRHHELPDALKRDVVQLTERLEVGLALPAERRLQGAGR